VEGSVAGGAVGGVIFFGATISVMAAGVLSLFVFVFWGGSGDLPFRTSDERVTSFGLVAAVLAGSTGAGAEMVGSLTGAAIFGAGGFGPG
jgi:hypothetical protein